MLSFVEISPSVPEKMTFEGFLPYMGMATILVMRPGLFMYILVPPSYRCFISNLALTGQADSEEIFEYHRINIQPQIAPAWGHTSLRGLNFFRIINPFSFMFYHIWSLRPSWSCDLDYLYLCTHWLPLPIDASYQIWRRLGTENSDWRI